MVHWVSFNLQLSKPVHFLKCFFGAFAFPLVKFHLHILCSFIRLFYIWYQFLNVPYSMLLLTTVVASSQIYIQKPVQGILWTVLQWHDPEKWWSIPGEWFWSQAFPRAYSPDTCFVGTLILFFCFQKFFILWFKLNTTMFGLLLLN